jgi:hypothetical protein
MKFSPGFKLIALIILAIGIISSIFGVSAICYYLPVYRSIINKLDVSFSDVLANPNPTITLGGIIFSLSDLLRQQISKLEQLIFFGILNIALGIGLLRLQDWAVYGTIIFGILMILMCLERLLFLGNLFYLSKFAYIAGIIFYTTIIFVIGLNNPHSNLRG